MYKVLSFTSPTSSMVLDIMCDGRTRIRQGLRKGDSLRKEGIAYENNRKMDLENQG